MWQPDGGDIDHQATTHPTVTVTTQKSGSGRTISVTGCWHIPPARLHRSCTLGGGHVTQPPNPGAATRGCPSCAPRGGRRTCGQPVDTKGRVAHRMRLSVPGSAPAGDNQPRVAPRRPPTNVHPLPIGTVHSKSRGLALETERLYRDFGSVAVCGFGVWWRHRCSATPWFGSDVCVLFSFSFSHMEGFPDVCLLRIGFECCGCLFPVCGDRVWSEGWRLVSVSLVCSGMPRPRRA